MDCILRDKETGRDIYLGEAPDTFICHVWALEYVNRKEKQGDMI